MNRDACSASSLFICFRALWGNIFGLNSGHTHTHDLFGNILISNKVAFESNYSVNIVRNSCWWMRMHELMSHPLSSELYAFRQFNKSRSRAGAKIKHGTIVDGIEMVESNKTWLSLIFLHSNEMHNKWPMVIIANSYHSVRYHRIELFPHSTWHKTWSEKVLKLRRLNKRR